MTIFASTNFGENSDYMKLSSQIKIRLKTQTRERFSNEENILSILKGLFVKRRVKVIEETFLAPVILQKLNIAFQKSGISDLIRISHDDTEFYLDKNNKPHDLEKVIEEFNFLLHSSFERFYEKISVFLVNTYEMINITIELSLMRLHPVGEYPIHIHITGTPISERLDKTEKNFKQFVETLEQNIFKYLDVANSNQSFAKYSSDEADEETGMDGEDVASEIKVRRGNFFPLYGVTLGETTIEELAVLGEKATDCDPTNKPYKYYTINNLLFWHDNKNAVSMYFTYTTPLPVQWTRMGLNWDLSYDQWVRLFKKLDFVIATIKKPKVEWYNGQKTLHAEFHASKKLKHKIMLIIEVYFNYSKRSSIMSKGTVYSLKFRVA